MKWSCRATLKSKASPRSTKPTPMKARRPAREAMLILSAAELSLWHTKEVPRGPGCPQSAEGARQPWEGKGSTYKRGSSVAPGVPGVAVTASWPEAKGPHGASLARRTEVNFPGTKPHQSRRVSHTPWQVQGQCPLLSLDPTSSPLLANPNKAKSRQWEEI